MAGMTMPGMPSDGGSSERGEHGAPPCAQSVPSANCQLMAPCVATVAALPASARVAALPPAIRVAATALLTPASRTTAPELPPPRA